MIIAIINVLNTILALLTFLTVVFITLVFLPVPTLIFRDKNSTWVEKVLSVAILLYFITITVIVNKWFVYSLGAFTNLI